jgi:predicted MPP superfamily phosphohydrolase
MPARAAALFRPQTPGGECRTIEGEPAAIMREANPAAGSNAVLPRINARGGRLGRPTRQSAPIDPLSAIGSEQLSRLESRLGSLYVGSRLRIEAEHESRVQRGNPHSGWNRYASPAVIRAALKSVGLYRRARANAEDVRVERNTVFSPAIPAAFDEFTILHVSDLHVDTNPGAMGQLSELLPKLCCDICVLTGDFRGRTHGAFAAALDGLARLRPLLPQRVYGVLGNHDSLLMVPGLEALNIRVLLNENESLIRDGGAIHLAGIDDAHFYRLDDTRKAAAGIPQSGFSILLSHTPEIYREAAEAGFDLVLSGHTHGGQICLPGAIPITLDSVLPRRMGARAWSYGRMAGYTSVGVGSSIEPVRLNCPPAITLHRLRRT